MYLGDCSSSSCPASPFSALRIQTRERSDSIDSIDDLPSSPLSYDDTTCEGSADDANVSNREDRSHSIVEIEMQHSHSHHLHHYHHPDDTAETMEALKQIIAQRSMLFFFIS